ncbi:MAG: stage III sporulation protein AE [Clostridia bacterium]|jgi:stage III sporulation protein AE|nr:stage III sporulation protein AE [Clostridium sp. CAG:343]HCF34758.1 stage III sporulation protein AE [Clostridiales bacterium]
MKIGKENFFIIEKIITIIVMVLIVFLSNSSYANDNQTIIEQQEEFKIQDFIKNAEKFTGEFFEDIDINEILNDAIKGEVDNSTLLKKILNILGKEVTTNIKSLVSILAIILIHSILKSISESLENNNISKLIYYVQYILIVTVIMSNFTDIIKLVQDTTGNLIGFMNTLVPLLITLMMYTGSITTSSVVEPIILFMINFIGNIIQNLIIPFVLVLTSLVIISKISDKVHIDKLSKFFKSGIVWFLGIVLTVFVGVVSLEGTLSSSIDGITAKTTKAVVSSAIPVVGKILGDAVDTVLGCGIVLKNAVGLVGVVIVIGICIMPILKLFVLSVSYKLLSTVVQPIADEKIIDLLEQIGDIFKIFLGILCAISFMLIIGTTLVLKISNGTMMYR